MDKGVLIDELKAEIPALSLEMEESVYGKEIADKAKRRIELFSRVIAALESDGWIPVETQKPKLGTQVLAYFDHGDNQSIDTHTWDRFWDWNEITHWKPLPPPPQDSK